MIWSRGLKNDWELFAREADDPAWNYESVLGISRRIEDWQGLADPAHRGGGGPVFVQPAPDPNPIAPVLLEAAHSVVIPTFGSPNGCLMEEGGSAHGFAHARGSASFGFSLPQLSLSVMDGPI
jgi:choline dehydrogenase